MRVVTGAQMKQIERNADEGGLSYYQMMENAGSAAAGELARRRALTGETAVIFAGKGNNGGDGLVVARLLAQAGTRVTVLLVDGPPQTADAGTNFSRLPSSVPVLDLSADPGALKRLPKPDFVVDAVYGTGFHPPFRENGRRAAGWMNRCGAPVYALDLPSGADADTAKVDREAVQAAATFSFDSLKYAHCGMPAKECCGEILCLDIGIREEWRAGLYTAIK